MSGKAGDTRPTHPAPVGADEAPFLVDMLERMAFIRAFEAAVYELSRTDPPAVVGSTHLCAGQEAVPLGAIAALREDDPVIATYRGHGWAIACDLDPRAVLAEICHRRTGLNGGRAGSAFFMAPHTRFIGENSIVGAGTTIACGLAMAGVHAGNGRVVVVSIGDGAMNQGSVHEAMAFAAVRRLPVIFVCENNGWSELTPTAAMFRHERLARRATGYGITGSTISGIDPLALRDSFRLAAEQCRAGEGPVLLECRVPRLWGHYNRDIEHYRPAEDRRRAQAMDPIQVVGARLIAAGHLHAEGLARLIQEQEAQIETLRQQVLEDPHPDPRTARDHVVAGASPAAPASTGAGDTDKGANEAEELTYIGAINTALREALENDPATVIYGEDLGNAGGIFGASRGLQKAFGAERVFDTPIAENAILGSAVGAALGGLKPVVEIMWADFSFVALDQLVNQAANIRYITGGRTSVPMVVRTQQGVTPGSCAQHSQSIEALLAHVPGLKVAAAATPGDAYALLRAAIADPDPCILIEARALYPVRETFRTGGPVEPVGRARTHGDGRDAAVITWSTMVPRALEAARQLSEEGIDITVVDLRWLSPLDDAAIDAAVVHCGGRIVVAHEAVRTGGFGAEIAARIHERHGIGLPCPVLRIATPEVRMPASPVLQAALVPDATAIVEGVRSLCAGVTAPPLSA